jgi:hypothetical protein
MEVGMTMASFPFAAQQIPLGDRGKARMGVGL